MDKGYTKTTKGHVGQIVGFGKNDHQHGLLEFLPVRFFSAKLITRDN